MTTPAADQPAGPGSPGSVRLRPPALVLAADHRARGVMTVERYADYLAALRVALPRSDGILASTQPLRDLVAEGAVPPGCATYLSVNRTGLAGSVFELDDRLVASVERAAAQGFSGVKHMVRIDLADPSGAAALELLGHVLEEAQRLGLEALVEPLVWRDGRVARDPDSIVLAAVVAHDMGAPVLKVPVPDAEPGPARVDAVARVVQSVGVPVLLLGGPGGAGRGAIADATRDAMAGGAAGMAVGRAVLSDPDPAGCAEELAALVHAPATAPG